MAEHSSDTVKVWDPLVRVFHWTLVIAFFTAYFTSEDELLSVHSVAGYVVASLVLFRILWGFVGSRHARFSDFVFSPSRVIGYLKDLLQGRAKRYIGHNPAGGAMIVLLLFSLLATTGTGLYLYAVDKQSGPLAGLVAEAPAQPQLSIISNAYADEEYGEYEEEEHEDGEHEDEWLEEVHEFFANFTILLVLLHISGVVMESLVHNENLARAMVTGRKRSE